jgi:CBS-domain-containing membrane protein
MNSPTIKDYVRQSLLAMVSLLTVLYTLDVAIRPIVVTAVASSTFIIFVMPHQATARPRNVIGGHAVGVLAGVCCALLLGLSSSLSAHHQGMCRVTLYAVAVGLAIAAMLLTDTRHPPAAGTALAMMINPLRWRTVAFILISVTLLSLVRWGLRSRLKDLG